MSHHDIVNRLPYRLRNRFDSLSAYVKTIIDEEERTKAARFKLNRDRVQLIQLVVFIYCLDDFLREGTNAARGAVQGLSRIGLDGFSVGSNEFSGDNENVTRGETLANHLKAVVSKMELFASLPDGLGITQLTRTLIKEIKNA